MIAIVDTTLREGEQTPGVCFSTPQKIAIARRLDAFGVDFIEAGHPAVSLQIKDDCEEVVRLGLRAAVIAHARALKKDVDAVSETGAPWAGIFFTVNELGLKNKYGIIKEKAFALIGDAISHAKESGLFVRFTVEDALRTKLHDIFEAVSLAESTGADRISLSDTVGVGTPRRMHRLICALKKRTRVPLHVHCHNDLGLAVANSFAAYEAGADAIDCTVNGLGERTGLAPLAEVVTGLKVLYMETNDWDMASLPRISRMVAQFSKTAVSVQAPVVGKTAFTHKAGIHQAAVIATPETYEAFPPGFVGRKRAFTIGPLSGVRAVREKLKQLDIHLGEKEIDKLLLNIKKIGRDVDDQALRSLATKLGRRASVRAK